MAKLAYPEDIRLPFGTFKGSTLGDILANNPAYLGWLSEKCEIRSDDLREAIRDMVEKYAAEIAKAQDEEDDDDAVAGTKPDKVYKFGLMNGSYILRKDNGLKFRMKGNEEEALDQAAFLAEAEDARLEIIGLDHIKGRFGRP